MHDDVIRGDKSLNRRQAECLYIIQKKLELKANHSLVHGTNFLYYIYETLRAFIRHCKNISSKRNYAHLPFLVTQLIRFIDTSLPLVGERMFCVKKKMKPEMAKRTTYWTHDMAYQANEEDMRRGFPWGRSYDVMRTLPFGIDKEKMAYIDASFRTHWEYVGSQIQCLY